MFKNIAMCFVMIFTLSGCFYQEVNSFDMAKASNVCGGYDKIVAISAIFFGAEIVTCSNGMSKSITNYIIGETE